MKIEFFHYKPLENLEHLIQLQNYLDQKVWFTRVDELNDPFEGESINPFTDRKILRTTHFENYYQQLQAENPTLTREEVRQQLNSGAKFYSLPEFPQ